jgi:hypothetical protein
MLRTVVALLGLTAAFAGIDARDTRLPGWFDLPVPGGEATLAALGIETDERALTLPVLSRAMEDRQSRLGRAPGTLQRILEQTTAAAVGGTSDAEATVVPAPLSAEVWRGLLALAPEQHLFERLSGDRRALLVAVGLMATDESIRSLMARDRDLLTFVHREGAAAFAIVGRSLRVDRDRVVVPGGQGAEAVWQRLAGSPTDQPSAFLRALVSRDRGRLAWYFDCLAQMDDARLAAAWPDGGVDARRDNAGALYSAFRESDVQWVIPDQPYRRNIADPWTIVMTADVQAGRLLGPSPEVFWEYVFSNSTSQLPQVRDGARPAGLTWLTRTIASTSGRPRRDRVEVFRLGQRVFPSPSPAALPDLAAALNGYARFRALLLALERMRIEEAATWAAVVTAARHVSDRSDDRRDAVTAFQAAVSLVERIRHARTIDVATTDSLLRTLSEAVQRNSRVTQSVGEWIQSSLMASLPPLERPDALTGKTAYESTILQALAGPRDRATPVIEWEGLKYRVDIVETEHERLRAVRAQLPSPGLDAAIANGRPHDLSLALTALVYAPALGEPEGAVALSRDVARRHDLGFDATIHVRDIRPWSLPEEQQGRGPWRVAGSLIGLDLGLSRLALRRLIGDEMPPAPTLTLNDFSTLTRSVVLMPALDLTDGDRDEIARAIARGRERVRAAGASVQALDTLAREAHISPIARQLIPWLAARQPDVLNDLFTLRDLMWLGQPKLSHHQLDRWGLAADGIDGRTVTAMPPPAPWENFAGRPDAGQITTQTPDLTLRIVEETARLGLPAVLVPSLLAFAVNDYWHDVQVRFADDWPRLSRQARALTPARVEDYVAALTGNGPLRKQ